MTLEECLALSDAVVSGVPSKAYQVSTDALKEGVVAINFSESKNFQPNIKDKVCSSVDFGCSPSRRSFANPLPSTGVHLLPWYRESHNCSLTEEPPKVEGISGQTGGSQDLSEFGSITQNLDGGVRGIDYIDV